MNKNIRWKLLASFAVFVIFFGVGVYPILAQRYHLPAPSWLMAKQLRLGLDLKGGVHLVLRVQTDDALKIHTTTTAEQIREALRTATIPVSSVTEPTPATFHIEGIPADKDAEFKRIATEQSGTNFDRVSGVNGAYDFRLKPNIEKDLREQAVVQALQTIERRVNELGVAEPNISRYGSANDQIQIGKHRRAFGKGFADAFQTNGGHDEQIDIRRIKPFRAMKAKKTFILRQDGNEGIHEILQPAGPGLILLLDGEVGPAPAGPRRAQPNRYPDFGLYLAPAFPVWWTSGCGSL